MININVTEGLQSSSMKAGSVITYLFLSSLLVFIIIIILIIIIIIIVVIILTVVKNELLKSELNKERLLLPYFKLWLVFTLALSRSQNCIRNSI